MSSPLSGKRIVVTRSAEQAAGLSAKLTAMGALPILFPTIQFVLLSSPELDDAVVRMDSYDWLILTSANAVKYLWRHLLDRDIDGELPDIAVSGSVTAKALFELSGKEPALVPEKYVASAVVDGLGTLKGKRILLPRSRIGGKDLVRMLEERGATVDDVALYDTVVATPSVNALNDLRQGFDVVTFASPSSVRNFLKLMERHGIPRSTMDCAVIACIGPVTADAVRTVGLPIHVEADPHTIDGLIENLVEYFSNHPGSRPESLPEEAI